MSDFDDLVFENRNRDYGAYQLRKKYNSVIIRGTIIATVLVSAAVIIPFLLRPRDEKIISGGGGYVQVSMQNLEPPQEKIYVPPAAPPPVTERTQEIVKYVPPEIVDSIVPVERAPLTADEVQLNRDKEIPELAGSGFGSDLLAGTNGMGNEEPFFEVEVMPTFRGGDFSKFRDWVGKRTNYPEAAIKKKIRGTVLLTFVVEKDGTVTNVTVVKGVDPILDNEAVKAVSESPKWSPGLQRGQPVRVRFVIPLSFV